MRPASINLAGRNNQHILTMPIATKQIPPLTPELQALFWKKVNYDGPMQPHMESRCWVWSAGKFKSGYGAFRIFGKNYRTHRVSLFLSNGPIPDFLSACHRCDCRDCVRPDHLFLGTCADNIRDACMKGRMPHGDSHQARIRPDRMARGESSGCSKLTEESVREIRTRYAEGGISQRSLAREFGVVKSTIASVVRQKNWKHVA